MNPELEKMLRALQQSSDTVAQTASKMFGVPEDKVTPSQRRDAKRILFGTNYGGFDASKLTSRGNN